MPYKLNDTYTSADIGLAVTGRDLVELFSDAALGLTSIMVDAGGLKDERHLPLALETDSIEDLFFKWLSELIYLKDAENFLFHRCEIRIMQAEKAVLKGTLFGDTIDKSRQTLRTDVKAVTYYKFRLEKHKDGWEGEVVIDI